jgi:hypothetical protein
MSDIVERLRNVAVLEWCEPMCVEAADEIERLREALRNITQVPRSDAAYGVIQCIASAALGETGHG